MSTVQTFASVETPPGHNLVVVVDMGFARNGDVNIGDVDPLHGAA